MNAWKSIKNDLSVSLPWDQEPFLSSAALVQRKKPQVTFVYPRETTAISCTEDCALNCAHCGGVYLKGMQSFQPDLASQSLLVSGGCDPTGRVPFGDYLPQLQTWRQSGGRRLNFHVGLIPDEDIPALKDLADTVSFDFVYHQPTINQVFGQNAPPEEYLRTFRKLREVARVIPHVCIGIKGGEIAGEREALAVLQKEDIDALAFIVFIPTSGTTYADCAPPPLSEVLSLFAEARSMFPHIPLHLGCMRPKGRYRVELDAGALALGFDKIVQPTPLARQLAEKHKLTILREEECCSL